MSDALTDRYAVERPLGQGGTGRVWLARHRRLALPVAVKVVDVGVSAHLVHQLQVELRLTAALDHPNIVPVLDQGLLTEAAAQALSSRPGAPWLALGYVAGGDLHRERGRWDWPRAHALALQLLDALAHAHGRGILHLDVKPSNVLADADAPADAPRWLLADFSISATLRDARPQGGSPGFVAPEQLDPRLAPVGPWSDLYGLGATLRQLLADPAGLPPGPAAWLADLLSPAPRRRLTAADARAALLALGPPGAPGALAPRRPEGPVEATATAGVPLASSPVASPVAPTTPLPAPLPATWRTQAHDRRAGPPLALVGLRPPPPVGRDDLLDAAWSALVASAAGGPPEVLALVGPPAADAAAVARAVAARAIECGVHPVVVATLGDDTEVESLAAVVRRGGDGPPLAALRRGSGPRPWLVVLLDADRGPAGEALAAEVLASGAPVTLLTTAHAWSGPGRQLAVGPLPTESARRLLREHFGLGAVFTWSLLERHGPWPGPLVAAVRRAWADERLVETYDGHELVDGVDRAGVDTGPIDELLDRARTLVGDGEFAAAEHALAEHEARAPAADRASLLVRASLRARLLWQLHRTDEAAAAAAVAVALAPEGERDDDVAEALRICGVASLDRGRPDAEGLLERSVAAARTRGRRARARFHLGNVWVRRGAPADVARGLEIYALALPDADGYPGLQADLHMQLAAGLRELRDLDGAMRHLLAAEGIRPDYAPVLNLRAVLLRDQGRHEEAVAACRRACAAYESVGRTPYHPLFCEGLSHWALARPAEARAAFAVGLERAAMGARVAAEGALHAVSIAPALALGDTVGAAAHVAGAMTALRGRGEGDLDVLHLLADALTLAGERAPHLVPAIAELEAEQRALAG